MTRTARARGSRGVVGQTLPFVLVLGVLTATLVGAGFRHRVTEASRSRAVASGEQHFRDIAADTAARAEHALDELDGLALSLGAVVGTARSIDRTTFATVLDEMSVIERFPDLAGVLVFDADHPDETVRLAHTTDPAHHAGLVEVSADSADALSAALAEARTSSAAVLARPGSVGALPDPVMMIVYPPTSLGAGGTQLALVFAADRFLSSALSGGHHVTVTLLPPGAPRTVSESAGDGDHHHMTREGATESGAVGERPGDHAHGDVVHEHRSGGGRFAHTSLIDVADQQWELRVVSEIGFLAVPRSQEALVILIAGLLAAAAVFWLARKLSSTFADYADAVDSLHASNARLTAGFDNSPIGMAEVDLDGSLQRVNDAFCQQVGFRRQQLTGTKLGDRIHPEDLGLFDRTFRALVEPGTPDAELELRYLRSTGTTVWVTQSLCAVVGMDRTPSYVLVQSQDVTDRRRAEALLTQRALHDELTGLPNRALFMDRLRQALRKRVRRRSKVAVVFIDLDRFKVVNDSLGHQTGDELLISVATRLRSVLREQDTIARFGGDEFVVLCEDIESSWEAMLVTERILGSLDEPIEIDGKPIHVTASTGISVGGGPRSSETAETMVRDADAAMYRAKDRGRSQIALFDDDLRAAAVERLELEQELRASFGGDELELHYQPIHDPRGGGVEGLEALVRWRHPRRGVLTPDAFLQLAADIGLVEELDRFSLRTACSQLATWSGTHERAADLFVAVNTSPSSFLDEQFATFVGEVLDETGLHPSRLWVEVTEGAFLDDTDAGLATIEGLHALGVRVAIDDFGTGYSSLSYLTRFSFDVLKVDRSFIRRQAEDQPHGAVLAAIAKMARAIGTPIVMEGIEDASQLALALDLEAEYVQGYLFDHPHPAGEVERRHLTRETLSEGSGAGPMPDQPAGARVSTS